MAAVHKVFVIGKIAVELDSVFASSLLQRRSSIALA